MTPPRDYLSSRSRALETQRCPRSRYLLHEAFETGYELVRQSIPLATGAAGHLTLASLLRGHSPTEAIGSALQAYEESCAKRGLNVKELEDASKVYAEQKALIEGLGWLADLRVVPALLQTYEVLEVEKMDEVTLWEDPEEYRFATHGKELSSREFEPAHRRGIWRSIPDALLRHREAGDLYVLSWKIPAELPRDTDARTDMQGLSETWALEQRLAREKGKSVKCSVCHRTKAPRGRSVPTALANGMCSTHDCPGYDLDPDPGELWPTETRAEFGFNLPKIRGVQMAYLLKGRKISAKEEGAVEGAVGKSWRHNSPLVWGYRDQSFPPKLAWSREWRCSAPHPMRKSKWYPSGECPGDGRLHRRGEDWQSFPVWESIGVREWIETLAEGLVTPEAGSALDSCWSLPVPNFRPLDQIERWHTQIVTQERQVARSLDVIREYEANVQDPDFLWHRYQERLDELFPQHTEKWCNDTYGSKCPAWEICWGPDSTSRDPLSSGLYQIRTPYRETPVEVPDAEE